MNQRIRTCVKISFQRKFGSFDFELKQFVLRARFLLQTKTGVHVSIFVARDLKHIFICNPI